MVELCDLHTHTAFSFDGRVLPFALCQAARRHGLFGLAMSEHFDFYADDSYIYYDLFRRERAEAIERMQGLFGGSLRIWKGIELGQPHYNLKKWREVMARESFDLVIGSIHDLPEKENIYRIPYRSQADCDRVFESYFHEMRRMIECCDMDILAHLDYPVRVMGGVFEGSPDLRRYEGMIRPILRQCAEKGIALEVNTAGMDKWQRCPGPGVWVLEAFRQYGGDKLTLGSDAHRAIHCARGFGRALAMIRQAGFDRIVYFEKRTPRFVPIGSWEKRAL